MAAGENSYCRLCAQLKHNSEVLNLQFYNNKRKEVIQKLNRVYSEKVLFDGFLPYTVCLKCLVSLDNTFEFVLCIERAQKVLRGIYLKQNRVPSQDVNDEDEYMYDPPDILHFFSKVPDFSEHGIKAEETVSGDAQEPANTQDDKKPYVSDDAQTSGDPDGLKIDHDPDSLEEEQDSGNTDYFNNLESIVEHDKKPTNVQDYYNMYCSKDVKSFGDDDKKSTDLEDLRDPYKTDGLKVMETIFVHGHDHDQKSTNSQVGQVIKRVANNIKLLPNKLEDAQNPYNIQDGINAVDTAALNLKYKNCQDTKSEVKNSPTKKLKMQELSINSLTSFERTLTWKDYTWICYYCKTKFPTIVELRTHSMEYHENCSPYRCMDCNRRISNLRQFVKHVRKHRIYLKFSCYKCHENFSTTLQLNIHARVHKRGKYNCDGCHASFPSIEELNEHRYRYFTYKDKNPPSFKDMICDFCNKAYKYRHMLITHLLTHQKPKSNFICDKCGKCFRLKGTLMGHMVTHVNVRPHQCEICKVSFKTGSYLKTHIKTHDGKKPFVCDQCGCSFKSQRSLTLHQIIHTGSLPYICSICKKGFRNKSHLTRHIHVHTGFKPYSCQICQRDFTNWPNYNKHMKRRHDTNMAKFKRTSTGNYPIDQKASEVIVPKESTTLTERRKQIDRKLSHPSKKTKNIR